jgi:hypothetical protein
MGEKALVMYHIVDKGCRGLHRDASAAPGGRLRLRCHGTLPEQLTAAQAQQAAAGPAGPTRRIYYDLL